MSVIRVQQKSYQRNGRLRVELAHIWRAATSADFVEIRKLQEKIEEQLSGNFPTPYDSYVEPGA
jgi:hypothetical protein